MSRQVDAKKALVPRFHNQREEHSDWESHAQGGKGRA